jgi:RNA 3'-terminal phosphate cyclase (ATP)
MLTIDGSYGEGGGQILRSSLALSIITGKPVCITKIRAARSSPGLQQQHLTSVHAAASVCHAEVSGNRLQSTELTFRPGKVQSGDYHFSVGTAGSCMLVLQTILPALMIADGITTVILEGGTHNPFAPPFDFLERCFLPQLRKIGPKVSLSLERAGFYPAGGGLCRVTIEPSVHPLQSLDITCRGKLVDRQAIAILSGLTEDVGKREVDTAGRILGWPQDSRSVLSVPSTGQGNVLLLHAQFENVSELVTGFGKRNVPAEQVAKKAARRMKDFLSASAPVGEHLADQLLLPLAIAKGGTIRCTEASMHTTTNIHTIQQFLEIDIQSEPQTDGSVLITVPSF